MPSSRHPTARELPNELRIAPRGPLDAAVSVPGSKSITNRALLVAALAAGESQLWGALASDDTAVMCEALRALGSEIDTDCEPWRVRGTAGHLAAPDGPLDVQNSGTCARFLTAVATLGQAPVEIDGNARMRQRPIADLVDALHGLGARVQLLGERGCPPLRVLGGGLAGGIARIDARRSSQYVSAVLLAAPYARDSVTLHFVDGELISRPYVDLTLDVMRAFGSEARWLGGSEDQGTNPAGDPHISLTEEPGLYVRTGRHYEAREYTIEPDASSAAYPFCAAAITGGRVLVEGMPARSHQADLALLDLLETMGCRVGRNEAGVEVVGPQGPLRSPGEVDMNALPDAVLAFSILALFADGPTLIQNVASLRIKETDRLTALETELRKLGARVETGGDWISIAPGPLRGAAIDTYDDHRMAMSFALAGLRIPGVVIRDPSCVSKTWPEYFDVFDSM
jgi:3-phosphoshikimate 1-carboxyvinyltransferase